MINKDIVNLLNEIFEEHYHNDDNPQYKIYCPFHEHHKMKMEINVDDEDEKFLNYHCWVCNKGGNNIYSLFKEMKLDKKYMNDLTSILIRLKKFNVKDDEINDINSFKNNIMKKIYLNESNTTNNTNNEKIELPLEYRYIGNFKDQYNVNYREAIKYLIKRGLTHNDIVRYKIGFCEWGKYKDRIIVPSYDKKEKLNYFITRDFSEKSQLKYLNPKFDKDIIINEYLINWNFPIILCEGMFDAISIKSNAIPLLGKFIRPKLLSKLIEHNPEIIVFLDGDAVKDSIDLCIELSKHISNNIYFVDVEDGHDPGGLSQQQIFGYIANRVVKFDLKNSLVEKIKMTRGNECQ